MSLKTPLLAVALFAVAFAGCDKKKDATEKKAAVTTESKKDEPVKKEEPKKEEAKQEEAAKPAAKASGIAGTYELDKEAIKTQMKAEIAKMPKKKQAMATMMLKLIDMITMEVVLKEGGDVVVKETKPALGGKKDAKPKMREKKGTWEMKDGKVAITTDKKTITCEPKDGNLVCSDSKPTPFKLVLKRKS